MKLKRKTAIYVASGLALVLLALGALNGCGDTKFGDVECPSGSLQASAGDKIIGPDDKTLTVDGGWTGGLTAYSPLIFTVFEKDGITPKNGICVVLYTDGFWFADDLYGTFLTGAGALNRIVKKTDESGNVLVYWATEFLPAAGTESQAGESFINAYSGAVSDEYLVKWTVSAVTATTPPTAAPIISTTTLPAGTETGAYSQTLAATGGTTPYTWTTASALPTGLTLSTAGVLSGTLAAGTAAGSPYTINVLLTDSVLSTATQTLTLTVNAVPTITTAALPNATTGVAYVTSLSAAGGTTPYGLWSATAMPGGLLFDTATGFINGTPTGPVGATTIDFTITDANGVTSPVVTLSLTVL